MAREPEEPDTMPGSVDVTTRGVDSVLGREVAMVSLPPARGEALTVRTEQVRRLAALHHPNLIEVYDVDGLAEDAESTLVMQSVDGRSLDAVVASAPWPAVSVAHVGAQVADGLAHAHAHGVVHGGIGPASLVVDETLHAWLTGFTAALRPAPAATPAAVDGGPAVSSPTEDVVALGAALRALLDTSTPVPAVLDDALHAMTAGRHDARTAASTLAEAAETCAHGDAANGVVPMAVYSARISTSRSGASDVTGPASGPTPSSGSGPASPSVPSPVPAAAAAAAAAAVVAQQASGAPAAPARAASPPSGSPAAAPAARRSGRQAHRGLRVAALGAATMAVAVASSAVLWAANSFSAPLPAPTGAAQGSPAVVADPALGRAAAPPAGVDTGVDVPGDARPPLLDVSTLGSSEGAPSQVAATSDRSEDNAASSGAWVRHDPPVLAPPDGWHPPYRPPWVPPRPTTTTPPSTTTTVPPTTTTTPVPTTTTPKPTTTTPTTTKPTTTKPTTTKPTTTKPTTTKPTTNSTGTSAGSTGQGVAGAGAGQGAGQGSSGTAGAAPGGAGTNPSVRAAGPVSPTPAVVASGR